MTWDIGSHRLDLLKYWFGEIQPVSGERSNRVHGHAVEDTSALRFKLPRQGNASAKVSFSWASTNKVDRLEIETSQVSLIADPLDGPDIIWIENGQERRETFLVPQNYHLPLIEDFIVAVKNGREPICSGQEGRKVNQILEYLQTTLLV